MNTHPFAKPSDALSDGLIYRFRLRPLIRNAEDQPTPFRPGPEEFIFDCVFDPRRPDSSGQGGEQEGTCHTPAGEAVGFRLNDEQGGFGYGVRAFAGPRWDPFIMDARAALTTIATGKLAFTDPGSRPQSASGPRQPPS